MLYAEVKTKDGEKGIMLMSECADDILADIGTWVDKEGLTWDELGVSSIVDRETDRVVAHLKFNSEGPMLS